MERHVKGDVKLELPIQGPHVSHAGEVKEVLEQANPVGYTFLCQRTGCLVDAEFCSFCDVIAQGRDFDSSQEGMAFCPFRYYGHWNGLMGEAALADT